MMPTSSDAWFDIKAQMNDEASATPIEVQALKDFLSGKISASIAAKQIMMMNDDDPFPFQDKLYRVSLLIFDAAMRFQAQQPSLMELLDALNQFSEHDINLTPWQKAQYPHWATCTFRDSFVEVMDPNQRAYWAERSSSGEEDEDPRDCYRRWATVNAFQAHFFLYDKGPMQRLGYCISIIRVALEQEPWNHPPNRPLTNHEMPLYDITILDAEVPAAAQWVLIAGHMIYENLGKEVSARGLPPSDLWPGDPSSLTKERWAFWKQRLRWVQQHDALHEETRAFAADASRKMDEIESGSGHAESLRR